MSFDEDDFDPWDVVSLVESFCRRMMHLSFVSSPCVTRASSFSLQPSEDFDGGGTGRGDDREEVFGAQHTLILMDCRPSMFVPSIPFQGIKISPIQAALEVSEKLLRTKVKNVTVQKNGKRDGVGIMLYGVPSTQTTTASLVDLEQPGIASIKKIQSYLEHTESLQQEFKLHDRTKEASWTFRKALQEASSVFAKAKYVLST